MYNYRAEVLPSKNLQPLPRSHKFHVTTMTEQTKSQILDGKAHDRVLAVSDSLPDYGSARQKNDVFSRQKEDYHALPPRMLKLSSRERLRCGSVVAGVPEEDGGDARAPRPEQQEEVADLHRAHQGGAQREGTCKGSGNGCGVGRCGGCHE